MDALWFALGMVIFGAMFLAPYFLFGLVFRLLFPRLVHPSKRWAWLGPRRGERR